MLNKYAYITNELKTIVVKCFFSSILYFVFINAQVKPVRIYEEPYFAVHISWNVERCQGLLRVMIQQVIKIFMYFLSANQNNFFYA